MRECGFSRIYTPGYEKQMLFYGYANNHWKRALHSRFPLVFPVLQDIRFLFIRLSTHSFIFFPSACLAIRA